ncbi:MAG: hypothetical protein IJP67_03235, partial [Oscillospiraceae bacterium]|nr:hypothetical protein [Oscillospiraceae bacterium]
EFRLRAEDARLKHFQEYYWAKILATGKYVTGAIFALKQFGWIDRSTEDKGATVTVTGEGVGGKESAK